MLKRPKYPLPEFIREALVKHNLLEQYQTRPPYQQNDYIGWITRAKTEKTRQKRLAQMLEELQKGTHYMKMAWRKK